MIKAIQIVHNLGSYCLQNVRWLFFASKKSNKKTNKVHLLVVKDERYVKLAKICIKSFLYYHPHYEVIINCDGNTLSKTKRSFMFLRLLGKQITFKEIPKKEYWQESKLSLITSLIGTHDFYMDCDLRWNGCLKDEDSDNLVFFVEEKPLSSYGFLESLISLIDPRIANATMKNTSFFSWSGSGNEAIGNYLSTQWALIEKVCSHNGFVQSTKNESFRVSEQVLLSLIPHKFNLNYKFLKSQDEQFDGSICESSYFGASGGRFAPWGNTLRNGFGFTSRRK